MYVCCCLVKCKLPSYHLNDFNFLRSNHSRCPTALTLLRRFQMSAATSTANSFLVTRKGLNNQVPFLSLFFKQISSLYLFSALNNAVGYWISKLSLERHPEGGYFVESYRSETILNLPEYDGPRHVCTAIYYWENSFHHSTK